MRKIYEQLEVTLSEFIAQRDDLLLLVPCAEAEVALLLKALRDLDRESRSDLFLLFADEFHSPQQFLNDVTKRLEEELKLTNECAADTAKLPPLPDEFKNAAMSPVDRLIAGMRYAHSLVRPSVGQHFLWGMGPTAITNEWSFYQLLAELLSSPRVLPWMRGARIVTRVPEHFEMAQSPFVDARRVRVQPLNIPPNAHEEELIEVAANPHLGLGDRMQAEVQLAYLDYAHGRFDAANRRFLKALAFYQWAEIPALEAVTICGLGDVALRQADRNAAQHWFECAVIPAGKASNPALLANIVSKLAAVAYMENRFADAEARYRELTTLKRAMIDEDGIVEALEWQGLSQERQNAYDRAVVCWEEGALICKAFELKVRFRPLIDHLRRGYHALGMQEELTHFDSEWGLAG
jgi:hypothetical protein